MPIRAESFRVTLQLKYLLFHRAVTFCFNWMCMCFGRT